MALDRLIAEIILLVGSIYLGYTLFTVVNHIGTAITLANSMSNIASASIYVPDAVIVNNGTSNQLYLVIYNNGHIPILIRSIYLESGKDITTLTTNNMYIQPGNYVIIHNQTTYTQCNVSIIFCIENTTICMVYTTNTTNYVLTQS
ncbi:MAG: hypothetical protein ACP5NQ_08590 [Vulcanisaeta sp.]